MAKDERREITQRLPDHEWEIITARHAVRDTGRRSGDEVAARCRRAGP